LFEKIQIEWFSVNDLKHRRGEFRGFYREIVDILLEKVGELYAFAKKRGRLSVAGPTRKLRKRHGGSRHRRHRITRGG
jgi:hypothetical protein